MLRGNTIDLTTSIMDPVNRPPLNTIIFWNSPSITDTMIKNYNDDGLDVIILDNGNKIIKFIKRTMSQESVL